MEFKYEQEIKEESSICVKEEKSFDEDLKQDSSEDQSEVRLL